ncbi:hypothetical protein CMI47_00450 [Candidatus Pacearchaeota archaeon]|nr:hypothetical protein [Candidatus Pacearchaeota archaeon]|tara:strand:- start:585 stop:995 length:411 start_codon:yes stop_codon:yes gene_type:complete
MKKSYWIVGIIVVLILVVLGFNVGERDLKIEVTDFESCIAAGNPAMESYPRQCRDPVTDQTYVEVINEDPREEERNYCDEASREGDVCIALYEPVCGWAGEDINCLVWPCASTYGNSCEACHDENVDYWTSGECPS